MPDSRQLRRLGGDGLARLLELRPDAAAEPRPRSLTELAERLDQPGSVRAALASLDLPTNQVAEAVAALGEDADRVRLEVLLDAGSEEARTTLDRCLDALRDRALLTGSTSLLLCDGAQQAWPVPLGLGPPAAVLLTSHTATELRRIAQGLGLARPPTRKADILATVLAALRDPAQVRTVTDAASDEARKVLEAAAVGEPVSLPGIWFPPAGRMRRDETPTEWCVSRGLVLPYAGYYRMAAEVALALRGDGYHAPFDPVPPQVSGEPADMAVVQADAVASASELLRTATAVLDHASGTPIALRRDGRVGVREMRQLGKVLGVDVAALRLALATADEAGLLTLTDDGATPTTSYDSWLGKSPAAQLAALLRAWWSLPYAATADTTSAWNPEEAQAGVADLRQALIQEASELDVAIGDPASLVRRTRWRRPGVCSDTDVAFACWREAGLTGATGAGAVSATGRALLGDDARALRRALRDLPEAQDTARIQADLTAVVPGTPTAGLAALLDRAADLEGRSAASTWRFTPQSVRRALDAGSTPESLLDELRAVATNPLPQPLEYLVRDVGRRHGRIRALEVRCMLRCDDPALVEELAATKRLRKLGLRAVAPTVLAAARPLDETVPALRAAGYAPVTEGDDGSPVVERAPQHRATPTPLRRAPAAAARPDPRELATALLEAPDAQVLSEPDSRTEHAVRHAGRRLTDSQVRILTHAIDHKQAVRIEYVTQQGGHSTRVIEPEMLSGTTVFAWCHLRDDERMFNLGRILGAEPVT